MTFALVLAVTAAIPIAVIYLAWSINKMSQSTDNFTAALTTLDTDIKLLIAKLDTATSGTQAAVDAFADQATASVNTIDAEVKAKLGA